MKKYFLASACMLLSGCAGYGKTFFGTTEITAQTRTDKVNLHQLLDPQNRRAELLELAYRQNTKEERKIFDKREYRGRFGTISGSVSGAFDKPVTKQEYNEITQTQAAYAAFYTYGLNEQNELNEINWYDFENLMKSSKNPKEKFLSLYGSDDNIKKILTSPDLAFERNRVQDTIIQASNEQCQHYKIRLSQNESNAQFVSTAAALAFGGLGAVFTDDDTVRALAAAAGISTGLGDAFSSSYLQDQTVGIIINAIDLERENIKREIDRKRFGEAADNAKRTTKNSFFWHQIGGGSVVDIRTTILEEAREFRDEAISTRNSAQVNVATVKRGIKEAMEAIARQEQELNAIDENNTEERTAAQTRLTELMKDKTGKEQVLPAVQERLEQAQADAIAAGKTVEEAERLQTESRLATRENQVVPGPIFQYSVEEAVADAVRYHAACSLVTGLETADETVSEARQPSVESLVSNIEMIRNLQNQINSISSTAPTTE